ncbi:flocculation protein FLO11-like [Haliotis rubra]|uniref:flocculation protein FLO11-like n=1 Tax=Haliotis rubra TaxID=36100 RepID=UPI001EE60AC2|nr:flocculation protein FLO11-like [Haliotis rubra]
MEPSVRKQEMDMNGVDTDNPTSYLKALFGNNSAWNKAILFPDLDQEYCEAEGSPLDVSYASTVDYQSEVEKTGHMISTVQSGSNADIHNSMSQTYTFTPTKVPEPSGTSTMDQAYVTQRETERHCRSRANDLEAMDVYSSQESMAATIALPPSTIVPLPTTNAPLPTNIVPLPTTITHQPTTTPPVPTTNVPEVEDILPLISDTMGTPGSLTMQLHGNPTQARNPMLQNPDRLPTSFTNDAEDVQAAADTPMQGAVPLQPDLSHVDLADLLQWIQGFEPTYQPNPTFGAATACGTPGIPDGNIPQLSEPFTTDSVVEPGSINAQLGPTTNPFTNHKTEPFGTPTSSSSSELPEILNILSGSTSNSAETDLMSTQTMVDPGMDLAEVDVLYQQHTEQSSHLRYIPPPEPEVMSDTSVAAHGPPTTVSVKEGLKSKIQLKRLQRGEKELMVYFTNKPSGELTEEEKQKIDRRKQRNKDSANRSRLNRQMKMKKQMQENAEAEEELEKLKSEVEKSRKVRDILQYWWDRGLCHVTTGFRKPPYHMGVNDLLDALEKYLASDAKV